MPLTDILACPPDQLEKLMTLDEPYSKGAWFMAKHTGSIALAKLGEILGVESYDNLFKCFKLVGEPLEEGPWPELIPMLLIEKLCKISEHEIISACDAWSKIDEFLGNVKSHDLKQYLVELQNFLIKNKSNTNEFFLVNAL